MSLARRTNPRSRPWTLRPISRTRGRISLTLPARTPRNRPPVKRRAPRPARGSPPSRPGAGQAGSRGEPRSSGRGNRGRARRPRSSRRPRSRKRTSRNILFILRIPFSHRPPPAPLRPLNPNPNPSNRRRRLDRPRSRRGRRSEEPPDQPAPGGNRTCGGWPGSDAARSGSTSRTAKPKATKSNSGPAPVGTDKSLAEPVLFVRSELFSNPR